MISLQPMERSRAKQLSPLTLAFYGDSVYELLVRRRIAEQGSRPPEELHRQSVKRVRASFQAAAYEKLLPLLDEDESDILKRGRNCTGLRPPKSSNTAEYHRATAVEVLFGYLSLIGETGRLEELFGEIYE